MCTAVTDRTIFSKLDENSGFWEIPLDEESESEQLYRSNSLVVTSTNFEYFLRWKSSNELCQEVMEGIEHHIDDILTHNPTQELRYNRAQVVLSRI